jgi:Asp-tRNA(Asn)/Glu-tRNA(Gln) amidotransferase A subunit family amidase
VIAINPDALASAARADASRLSGKMQPTLAGISIVIKDTIERLTECRQLPGLWR